MGNEQSQIKPQDDFCPVIRYTVEIIIRYKGTFKEYTYVSKEYGVEFKADHSIPVIPYDEERWKDVHNHWTTVLIKRSTLELCKRYLELQNTLTNTLQMELERTP